MARRVCIETGCPELTDAGNSRCTTHARAKDKARGTRQQRGYDATHDRLRAAYQRAMDRGRRFNCWRCGKPIDPNAWDLGHDDADRSVTRGPECVKCNRGTASRR